MSIQQVNLQYLVSTQFDAAKFWWGVSFAGQLLVLAIGVLTTFSTYLSKWVALLAALLAIGSALTKWRSDHIKQKADTILQKKELYDGLGWSFTSKELTDLLIGIPKAVREHAMQNAQTDYFSSASPESPKRLMENLEESACFTKHQAKRMSEYTFYFCVMVGVVALMLLISAIFSDQNPAMTSNIARVTILVITFVFLEGYARLAYEYYDFANSVSRLEDRVHDLLMAQVPSEVEAIKLIHEYQMSRAMAPLLPGWLWKRMENELNELWQAHRQARSQP